MKYQIIIVLFLCGCFDADLKKPVIIILPNDFVGEFRIGPGGANAPETPDGYIFAIPAIGELKTDSVKIFNQWHQVIVKYEDGRVIADYTKDVFSGHGHKIDGGSTNNLGVTTFKIIKLP